jgi:hypothetical protein
VTALAAYVRVHWTAAGSLPAAEVKVKFRVTVLLVPRVADDKVKEPLCPKEGWITAKNIARIGAPRKGIKLRIQLHPTFQWAIVVAPPDRLPV